jgi:hypothetical protein
MKKTQPEAQIRWKALHRLLRVRLRYYVKAFQESKEFERISNDIWNEGSTGNSKGGLFDLLK